MQLRANLGLDDPVWQRYWHWLTSMLKGDWGFSFISRLDVDTLIWQRLPVTIAIIGMSQLVALAIALPVGVLAAVKPYSWFDRIASTLSFIGFSLPTFFTGLLFILFFSIYLDWFPFVFQSEIQATGWAWWVAQFKQSIMPIMVLGLFQAASWMRYVRSAVLDVIRLDYVTTARSKGLGMLSMWSIARDKAGPVGQVANTHSGTAAADGSFSARWGDYGTDPVISGGITPLTPPATGGTATSPPAVGGTLPIAVAAAATTLSASATSAERFQLSYAWGRRLTINGFDPGQDVLDLKGFWAEGQQARVMATPGGASVLLDFNAQQVLLPGVDPGALTSAVVQTWQG